MRTKKQTGSLRKGDAVSAKGRGPLVGKEEMGRWQKWKDRRTLWHRFRKWFAWGVFKRGPQRDAMDAEFNDIFRRLVPGNPILESPQALICRRTTHKQRELPPNNLKHRLIKLVCTFPVNLFDLQDVWPVWRKEFGLNTRYHDFMEKVGGSFETLKQSMSFNNDTESSESSEEENATLALQEISFVITDSRFYPYRLGARTGVGGGEYDDPYAICVGGRLQKDINDLYLPPDALPNRCTGFLGYKEINNMMRSVIKGLVPGKLRDLDTLKEDIQYMAQWLILSGFDGKDKDCDSQATMNAMITKANELGLKHFFGLDWQTLYDTGKLFATSWLDRVEGREIFFPAEGLIDFELIDESTLTNLLLPLGAISDADGSDTMGEQQWERMTHPERKYVVQLLQKEYSRLETTVATVDAAITELESGTENKQTTVLKLKELAKLECKKLLQIEKVVWCEQLLASGKSPQLITSEIKSMAFDVATVGGFETGLSSVLKYGAQALNQNVHYKFDPKTLLDHTDVVNTAPLFDALGHVRHGTAKVGKFFFPGATRKVREKVQELQNMPTDWHQHVHVAKDLMPGNATLKASFDMQATEHFSGLAEYISSGNPDHMQAAIHVSGTIGVYEDGVITGAANGADAVSQTINDALQQAASQSPLLESFINGVQRCIARHALPNSTLADASRSLITPVKGFAQNNELAQALTDHWPDTVQRNAWLHAENTLKQQMQNSIDKINWLEKDQQLADAIHQLNSMVQVVHPHVDATVKYDVVASAKIVNGQLVLHEVVKLHPDIAVHSGFLADLGNLNPLTFILAATPLAHLFWIAYRVGIMLTNLNWHFQMSDIAKKWNGIFHGEGDHSTACVCQMNGQGVQAWPTEALARNPDDANRKRLRHLPGEGLPKYFDSKRQGIKYWCREICTEVALGPDGMSDTRLDVELNSMPRDPNWELRTAVDGF